ncbi:MAG: signal transduction histidine kinase [Verrucomicrobiales bacterium]|jgi:signal transduction histidine kinase
MLATAPKEKTSPQTTSARSVPSKDSKSPFLFADHLVLDNSPTRDFYIELLRGLAHKNNNVLAVVQGFSSLILMGDNLDENTRENIGQMRNSAQHSSSLSERVLSTGGCGKISPQSIQLSDFLPLADGLRDICSNAGVGFTQNITKGIPPIVGDINRLRDIFVELVKNAAEGAAHDVAGHVQLDVLAPGEASPLSENRVDIFIRNNGPGIPEQRLAEMFLPFETTKGSNHFGIGLTTAGVLAGQMGMRLGIASETDVTTVWVSAPVFDPETL